MWNFYFTRGSKFCDHSEHFCDYLEAKLILETNVEILLQAGIEILELNPLQNSLLVILSILEKNLL